MLVAVDHRDHAVAQVRQLDGRAEGKADDVAVEGESRSRDWNPRMK